MPNKPGRICPCGHRIAADERCACQKRSARENKARHDRTRPNANARGYGADWRKARVEFLKAFPHCRMCGAPASVVDHIEPHKGDERAFWNKLNWQPLCQRHHNQFKQAQERRDR